MLRVAALGAQMLTPTPATDPPPRARRAPRQCPVGFPVTREPPADIWKVFACDTSCSRGAKASCREKVAASASAGMKKPGVTGSDQPGKGCS